MISMRRMIIVVLVLALAGVGAFLLWQTDTVEQAQFTPGTRTLEQQTGTVHRPVGLTFTPLLREITAPVFQGANSIWGATGRDDDGHIWLGVSGNGKDAAHLVEYDPDLGRFINHGDAVSALRSAGIYREGEEQVKIHSKIIQMDDGWLYFASMDETGENGKSGQLPRGGAHFWRYKASAEHGQHLFAAPEGLIAVSGVGRFVYALGYWGHVLYRYDTHTGEARHIRVGSED